jgi:hypothetical protein
MVGQAEQASLALALKMGGWQPPRNREVGDSQINTRGADMKKEIIGKPYVWKCEFWKGCKADATLVYPKPRDGYYCKAHAPEGSKPIKA